MLYGLRRRGGVICNEVCRTSCGTTATCRFRGPPHYGASGPLVFELLSKTSISASDAPRQISSSGPRPVNSFLPFGEKSLTMPPATVASKTRVSSPVVRFQILMRSLRPLWPGIPTRSPLPLANLRPSDEKTADVGGWVRRSVLASTTRLRSAVILQMLGGFAICMATSSNGARMVTRKHCPEGLIPSSTAKVGRGSCGEDAGTTSAGNAGPHADRSHRRLQRSAWSAFAWSPLRLGRRRHQPT